MNTEGIIDYLQGNDLSEVELLSSKDNVLIIRFTYDFDKDELDAARAYANDESREGEGSADWNEKFFFPYLTDIATDNIGDTLEECMEKFDVAIQFVSYELDEDNHDYAECIGAFYEKGKEIDIYDYLDMLDL